MDCSGWRLFDIAINDSTRVHDMDIWKEVGSDHALKKTLKAHVANGKLIISFPKIHVDQAIISAIAIATKKTNIESARPSPLFIQPVSTKNAREVNYKVQSWLDTGEPLYTDNPTTFSKLPSKLYGAEWIRFPDIQTAKNTRNIAFKVIRDANVYIGMDSNLTIEPA